MLYVVETTDNSVVVNWPENKPQTFEATDYLIIDLWRSAWLQNHAKEESETYHNKGAS